ncbi:lipase 4, partial [Podospora australis]
MGRRISFLLALCVWVLYVVAAAADNSTGGIIIDLGYGIYTGVHETSSGLDIWRGIRYAAPPLGKLRWQVPQPPSSSSDDPPILADKFGPACPQTLSATPGASSVFIPGNEDCLFLNVYSPAVRKQAGVLLPVMVVIHGGGYGLGTAGLDITEFLRENSNGLVAVTIQYRLGAFGFLASAEVKSRGVLNAGLLDQQFALQWVQKHIGKFGGDPRRVTISGESAGAGSVLLHAIARDGGLGTELFQNIIAASPWIPTQSRYHDALVTRHYYDFSALVGCPTRGNVFDCLTSKDSLVLQYAANLVSTTTPTPHGNWAFIPVTDGEYITGPPSVLLQQGRVNGIRLLAGNNANEGSIIPPSTIRTQNDLVTWLKQNFPNLSKKNITSVLEAYPSFSGPVDPTAARYETNGYGPGTAVNISQVATGQQQRCFNIYAEASVICPSYWFASAFTGNDRTAYHYQYSVPFSVHAADLSAYYGPPTENQGPDLVTAFRKIYGNFVSSGNPSISNQEANGRSGTVGSLLGDNPASNWPAWTNSNPSLLNLNQTGGVPYTVMTSAGVPVTQFRGPGLRNNFTLVNAYMWEGGRGQRCEFWRKISPFIPQ